MKIRHLIFSIYTGIMISISILAYLNIIPTKEIHIPYYDLIGHFILYGFWAFVIANAFRKPISARIHISWGIVVISFITIIEEYLQSFSPVRSFSFADLACSLLGIACGVMACNRTSARSSV